jgi:hypothetical protein
MIFGLQCEMPRTCSPANVGYVLDAARNGRTTAREEHNIYRFRENSLQTQHAITVIKNVLLTDTVIGRL